MRARSNLLDSWVHCQGLACGGLCKLGFLCGLGLSVEWRDVRMDGILFLEVPQSRLASEDCVCCAGNMWTWPMRAHAWSKALFAGTLILPGAARFQPLVGMLGRAEDRSLLGRMRRTHVQAHTGSDSWHLQGTV